jgi:hypothetical protein
MPGVAQVPVVMPVAEVVSVSRVVSGSANELSVRREAAIASVTSAKN